MRVVSGTARGKKLKSPKDTTIRPTLDRVKESLFNILGRRVFEAKFLDLFSGSGAIGIEAISRGAQFTVFVDQDTGLTRENLKSCKFDKDRYRVLESDIKNFITKGKLQGGFFDIIFMDPPYGFPNLVELIEMVVDKELLDQEGILILEMDIKDSVPEEISTLIKYDERLYSITKLSFYEGKK